MCNKITVVHPFIILFSKLDSNAYNDRAGADADENVETGDPLLDA